jgi:hypothetical protein
MVNIRKIGLLYKPDIWIEAGTASKLLFRGGAAYK